MNIERGVAVHQDIDKRGSFRLAFHAGIPEGKPQFIDVQNLTQNWFGPVFSCIEGHQQVVFTPLAFMASLG